MSIPPTGPFAILTPGRTLGESAVVSMSFCVTLGFDLAEGEQLVSDYSCVTCKGRSAERCRGSKMVIHTDSGLCAC